VGKVEDLPAEAHVAEATIGPAGLVLSGQDTQRRKERILRRATSCKVTLSSF
jgi:hypothetical protein